ncbi:orotate phosphoribosyltransferase [Paenibacillus piri]|uniref:Orotate phosphoribosyltransferase n=1 Tax=Paenibacillus piri TaxID=2547395 RepID=A0A4R5KRA0_9BACL|nr:orotate phosphoribosyltransferase [Paenibacillus piri]TDF98126.1 orotate phosphoribosyltransferase [Paenibacillus piri]
MNHRQLAGIIYRTAHIAGTFQLRSGQISDQYFDKYLFESDPNLLTAIAEQLKPLLPPDTELLAGLELGGIPVATALSISTGIPAVYVRKKPKDYGTAKLTEGPDIRGKNICIIEDVATTGGQILLSAADLLKSGARLGAVLCVIERGVQGRINLEREGLSLKSLFTVEQLISAAQQEDQR